MKNIKIAKALIALFLFISFMGCTTKYEERLEGVWEWVDITNIETDIVEEWHFIEFDLTIYRYDKNKADSLWNHEAGHFFMDWSLFGKTLVISETSLNSYNTEWDVLQLKNDVLIITNDVDGGIMYKEFVKLYSD